MKQTANQLFESLSKEFSNKKEVINEELGQVIELKPLVQLEATPKRGFEVAFEKFLAEGGTLDPILNDDMKTNTKEKEEKVKADPKLTFEMNSKMAGEYKVSDGVKNIDSHNYDYTAENINNVNAQEMLTGIQCEINYNKELTLDEAKEIAVKNLSKDPLHYVKEGQFGVKGLGYKESTQNQNEGETFGGSGYSAKLKDGGDSMIPVKESKTAKIKRLVSEAFGQVVTTGNPNSYAAQSGNIIRQMMAETEDEGTAVSYSEAAKPDFMDIDGDGDKKETMKKAGADKKKKPKKDSIDSKLAEIGAEAEAVKMEAQINYLDEIIDEKNNRLSSISEDENLSELVDKKKMKEMEKEVKFLGKKKAQMEKVYEKMCGKAYTKPEMVANEEEELDEMDAVSWNRQNNPTQGPAGERDPKKVGQSTSAYGLNK
jgi:hypothetical protein|tara:strand:+ start:667 stop:1950 length:1284 start_codon:yes stop_codon:yes gene_type:complete